MNKSLLVTALLAVAPYTSLADVMPKEAYKAMLNLFAYDANGKLLRSGTASTLTHKVMPLLPTRCYVTLHAQK